MFSKTQKPPVYPSTYSNQYLKTIISDALVNLGFSNARQIINGFSEKLHPHQKDNINYMQLEFNLLKLIRVHFSALEKNASFAEMIRIMKLKSMQQSCESVLKLILFCNTQEKVEKILLEINQSKQLLDEHILYDKKQDTNTEIEKILGYLLVLNLNKYTYSEIAFFSLSTNPLDISNLVKSHLERYISFIKINKLAHTNSTASGERRNILFQSGLFETHLQRDPEEIERYNEQMASAQEDKNQLLDDISQASNQSKVAVVDIGPAGGATFKSVVAKASEGNKKVRYYGVEYDKKELDTLNNLLDNYSDSNQNPKQLMKHFSFLQGNAFDLSHALSLIKKNNDKVNNYFLSIVLSSVIHEIYSYCENPIPIIQTQDIQTMSSSILGRYNPETVYKIYYEALKGISEHKAGGSLNIRDGVMCRNPDEAVAFSINDEGWLAMFKEFLNDVKYAHLKELISSDSLSLFQVIKIPAKYLQEFVLKANWGPESFGNEINEIYCYMTLDDHLKLIQQAANEVQLNIAIPVAKEYVQSGYRDHINESKIRFFSRFNLTDQFPSTNMLIKVVVDPQSRENKL